MFSRKNVRGIYLFPHKTIEGVLGRRLLALPGGSPVNINKMVAVPNFPEIYSLSGSGKAMRKGHNQ
jgi:hypothetical protein